MLGDPDAPLTVTEYVDLQCPACAAAARETLPALVRDHVRTGKVKLEARTLHFLGPDSERAARFAAGAARAGPAVAVPRGVLRRPGAGELRLRDRRVPALGRRRRGRRRRCRVRVRRQRGARRSALEPRERRRRDALGVDSTPTFTVARGEQAPRAVVDARVAGGGDRGARDERARAARGRGGARPSGGCALASAVVALAGLAIAGYLTVVHYAGGAPVCAIAHGCETVQQSRYAELAGVPVALLGLLGYAAILASLARDGEAARTVTAFLALAGLRLLGLADLRRAGAARRDLQLVRRARRSA